MMKPLILIAIPLLLFSCKNEKKLSALKHNSIASKEQNIASSDQDLIIIEQDYEKALRIASQEDKLVFIDFYTTWCAPCKKLDKLVFQNDSIQSILGKNFVMLKYDAENDTIFHLSKKHHVSSYPTGIVLNKDGYVLNRKYGFPGQDALALQKKVIEFTDESIALSKENKFLKGYSNKIKVENYPNFYIDFINRTNTNPKTSEIVNFIKSKENFFKEEDFTTLFYFGNEAPSSVGDIIVEDKQKYFELYGKQDVEVLLYFIASAKFNEAISENNEKKYRQAVTFTKKALSQGWVDDMLPRFEIDRLKDKNEWLKVFEIYEKRKNKDGIDEEEINYICSEVYKKCNDQKVIAKCIEWMKEITNSSSKYAYLDTYTFLLYKSGNKEETKKVANKAIKVGKKEGEDTTKLEKLMKKL